MIDRKGVDQVGKKLRTLVCQRVSVSEWVRTQVNFLLKSDSAFGDRMYLQKAMTHMQAYMEMGFCYEDCGDCFDEVLRRLGTCRELVFPRMLFPAERIPVNEYRIKLAIGRWYPAKTNSITKEQLVADVIGKINRHQEGHYVYLQHCARGMSAEDARVELFVGARESYLYSGRKKLFYVFKTNERQVHTDESCDC